LIDSDLKADVLVFAAHPDDAELSCSGTICSLVAAGKKVVIADLTQGEMGTRGTIETRKEEAAASSEIMGLADRVQLYLPDTRFGNTREEQNLLIQTIRRYRPEIVLCNAVQDRHPDHGRSAKLEEDACFFSGLTKIETTWEGELQQAWRPRLVLHYIQDRHLKPDLVVDITPFWEKKISAIRAFKTQFYDPNNPEPDTYISNPAFLKFVESRSREFGHTIGVEFGEGFTAHRPPGVKDLMSVI
jgi:bacillithiol biosynthesis deacetylase BshB1